MQLESKVRAPPPLPLYLLTCGRLAISPMAFIFPAVACLPSLGGCSCGSLVPLHCLSCPRPPPFPPDTMQIPLASLDQAMSFAIEGCRQIYDVMRAAVQMRTQVSLLWGGSWGRGNISPAHGSCCACTQELLHSRGSVNS